MTIFRIIPPSIPHTQVNLLWEGAAASFRTSLEGALESVKSASIMVLLKDFVLLMCGALEACGYCTGMIEVWGAQRLELIGEGMSCHLSMTT